MRIQHNIMAMNAYRNYNNNNKALSSNLEKLSSGYKINRAGDDAAGLAISEKMRAQITGLNAAQKNVKDGISLVKTGEGAMQEIQDMLNRMDYLATQSANGTYDNEVDRANLQKEVEALKTEINRIADSANFNGINLLDGSMEKKAGTAAKTERLNITGMDRILTSTISDGDRAHDVVGVKTIFDTYASTATKAVFEVDLSTLKFNYKYAGDTKNIASGSAGIGDLISGFNIQIGDLELRIDTTKVTATMAGATKVSYTKTGSIAATFDSKKIAKLLMDSAKATSTATSATVTINGVSWKMVGASATGKLTFTQIAKPETMEEANSSFQVKVNFEDTVSDNVKLSMAGNSEYDPGTKTTTWGVPEGASKKANTVFKMTEADIVDGAKITLGQGSTAKVYTLKVGRDSQVTGTKVIDLSTMEEGKIVLSTALSKIATTIGTATFKAKNAKGSTIATTFRVTYTEEGIGVFRAASASSTDKAAFNTLEKIANNFKLSYNKTTAATEDQSGLVLQIGDTSDSFNQMEVSIGDMHTKALGIDGIDISNQEGAAAAVQTIKDAINYVSSVRGDLGAVQNRLDHTANNLSVMAENIQDAESTIRDTDVAEEMMSYVKNNILIQSAQAMLAQANQVPQGVLQLLG